mgnify:CR=1 FL=1
MCGGYTVDVYGQYVRCMTTDVCGSIHGLWMDATEDGVYCNRCNHKIPSPTLGLGFCGFGFLGLRLTAPAATVCTYF